MANIYIVRHGQAASSWDQDLDPPLSELGQQQAQASASKMISLLNERNQLDSIQCVSSPILRAHETAQAFQALSQKEIIIEPRVAEIPSPIDDLQERMPWLMSIMKDSWPNLSSLLNQWREDCINYVSSLEQDTLIFSHYIAINVLIGHCRNDERVICYHPDNASVHHFNNDSQGLTLVSLGKEANTTIN